MAASKGVLSTIERTSILVIFSTSGMNCSYRAVLNYQKCKYFHSWRKLELETLLNPILTRKKPHTPSQQLPEWRPLYLQASAVDEQDTEQQPLIIYSGVTGHDLLTTHI